MSKILYPRTYMVTQWIDFFNEYGYRIVLCDGYVHVAIRMHIHDPISQPATTFHHCDSLDRPGSQTVTGGVSPCRYAAAWVLYSGRPQAGRLIKRTQVYPSCMPSERRRCMLLPLVLQCHGKNRSAKRERPRTAQSVSVSHDPIRRLTDVARRRSVNEWPWRPFPRCTGAFYGQQPHDGCWDVGACLNSIGDRQIR